MSQTLPVLEKSHFRSCILEPTAYKFSSPSSKLTYDPSVQNKSQIAKEDAGVVVLDPFELEFSLHLCPISMRREVAAVFPSLQGNKVWRDP